MDHMTERPLDVQYVPPPWVRFFPSDWLARTSMLRPAEVGVFIRLVAVLHERGRPVKDDVARLARLCCATPATFRQSVETLVDEGLILRREGLLWSTEVEREIDFRSEKSSKSRSAAKKRWGKSEENQWQDHAGGMPDQSHSQRSDGRRRKPAAQDRKLKKVDAEGGAPDGRPLSAEEDRTSRRLRHRRMLERCFERAADLGDIDKQAITIMRDKLDAGDALTEKGDGLLTRIFRGLAADGEGWAEDEQTVRGART
jgi:uncharacterized protein YdaU (DUF1376 family)